MFDRRIGRRRLAAVIGTSDSMVAQWRSGRTMPRLDSTIKVAQALNWPSLVTLAEKARSGNCESCGQPFLNEGGSAQRYCSDSCRRQATRLQRLGGPTRSRAAMAERKLRAYESAVLATCNACEPDGYCREIECPLRPVSPLPLMHRQPEELPQSEPAPGPYGTPENRSKVIAAIKAANTRRWARVREAGGQPAAWTESMAKEREKAAPEIHVFPGDGSEVVTGTRLVEPDGSQILRGERREEIRMLAVRESDEGREVFVDAGANTCLVDLKGTAVGNLGRELVPA